MVMFMFSFKQLCGTPNNCLQTFETHRLMLMQADRIYPTMGMPMSADA